MDGNGREYIANPVICWWNVAKKKHKHKPKPLVSHGKCRKCGLSAKWVQVGERWALHNPDGTDHWDLCKEKKNAGKVYKPIIMGVTYTDQQIINSDETPW